MEAEIAQIVRRQEEVRRFVAESRRAPDVWLGWFAIGGVTTGAFLFALGAWIAG